MVEKPDEFSNNSSFVLQTVFSDVCCRSDGGFAVQRAADARAIAF
jgi:hypothetical protein